MRPLLISAVLLTFALPAQAAPPRLHVLIIDGVNNHDWAQTTPVLAGLLEDSGRFVVEVSTTPPRGASPEAWAAWHPDFRRYDVVISNFNGGDHGRDVIMWPKAVEADFETYVKNGGGFVSYHAANNAFPGWTAYEEMVGLLWRPNTFGPGVVFDDKGQKQLVETGTGLNPNHPKRYDFTLTIVNRDHPITRGLPAAIALQSEQLTYGQHGPEAVVRGDTLTFLTYAWCDSIKLNEPLDWLRAYGKGRVYVTQLGHTWHDEPSPDLANAGFRTLFLRGVEWAATGKVTLPVQKGYIIP